jgi:hypothetical protein
MLPTTSAPQADHDRPETESSTSSIAPADQDYDISLERPADHQMMEESTGKEF